MKLLDGSSLPLGMDGDWSLEIQRSPGRISAVGPEGNEIFLDGGGTVGGTHLGSEAHSRFLRSFLEVAGDEFIWRWPEAPGIVVIRNEKLLPLGESRWVTSYDLSTLVESPGSWYCSDQSDPSGSNPLHRAAHAYFKALKAPQPDPIEEARRVSKKYRELAESSLPGQRSPYLEVHLSLEGLLESIDSEDASMSN